MGKKTLRIVDGYSVYNRGKYENIYVNGVDMFFHIYVWEKENGKKPEGHDIHHLNFIKNDNRLENLQLLSYSDHRRVHSGWIMVDGVWTSRPCRTCNQILPLSDFYKDKKGNLSGLCMGCSKKKQNELNRLNPIPNREKATKHYYDHQEEKKEYARNNYKTNKDRYAAQYKERYELKKEQIKAYVKQYKKDHREQYREYGRKSRERKKLEALTAAQTVPGT